MIGGVGCIAHLLISKSHADRSGFKTELALIYILIRARVDSRVDMDHPNGAFRSVEVFPIPPVFDCNGDLSRDSFDGLVACVC